MFQAHEIHQQIPEVVIQEIHPQFVEPVTVDQKSLKWNRQRNYLKKCFQTVLGLIIIFTAAYLQFAIVYYEEIRTSRMIIQTAFVGLQQMIFFVIVIGISEIQFKQNHLTNMIFLTIFNDNSEELESHLQQQISFYQQNIHVN